MNWLADKIEQWPTAKLLPYARNARTHSEEQVAQIAASIAEFGFTNPILAGSDGIIVAGHGRLAAAQKLATKRAIEALGVRLDWKVADDLRELPVLDPSSALHLLRLVQEALGNALKHSGASVVTMSLGPTADGTLIQIADNGSGFDPSTVRHGRGMGPCARQHLGDAGRQRARRD